MLSRREIFSALGALPLASAFGPGDLYAQAAAKLPVRMLGRTGFPIVPYALGGIGSIKVPATGVDPADIIVRAVQLGMNYLDTANVYGPSQVNYGEAFRRLHLTPSDPDFNAPLRARLWLASKTSARYSYNPPAPAGRGGPGGPPPQAQVRPQGQATPPAQPGRGAVMPMGRTAIDDLKRTMTQIFGDGQGFIPDGAYLDCMQIHDLRNLASVDQIYEGLADRGAGKRPERMGALAGLLDYRDGTNYSGENPEHRIWIRHIGVTSHANSAYLMKTLRMDTQDIFDTVLMALNANDRRYDSMQNNALPMAVAKGMGVITMKIFADGVMWGGPKRFLGRPEDVILSLGKPDSVNYGDLIRYPLSLPGVTCSIVGIGKINREKPEQDQMVSNLAAAMMDLPDAQGRVRIEEQVADRVGKDTNFFQESRPEIIQPSDVKSRKDGERIVVEWNTAMAGPEPLRSYEIRAGEKVLASLPFRPQLTEAPLRASVLSSDAGDALLTVVASTAMPKTKA
jgi:aryl-alcohol dehydrogenase-like predicted oxidoreductase